MFKRKPDDDPAEDPDAKRARTGELGRAWAAWSGRLKSTDSQTTELMWFAFQAGFDAGARRGKTE